MFHGFTRLVVSLKKFREAFSISFLDDRFFFFIVTFLIFATKSRAKILRFFVEGTLSSMGEKEKKKRETKIEGEMLKQASQGNGMKREDKEDGDKRSFSRYNSRRREGDKCFF